MPSPCTADHCVQRQVGPRSTSGKRKDRAGTEKFAGRPVLLLLVLGVALVETNLLEVHARAHLHLIHGRSRPLAAFFGGRAEDAKDRDVPTRQQQPPPPPRVIVDNDPNIQQPPPPPLHPPPLVSALQDDAFSRDPRNLAENAGNTLDVPDGVPFQEVISMDPGFRQQPVPTDGYGYFSQEQNYFEPSPDPADSTRYPPEELRSNAGSFYSQELEAAWSREQSLQEHIQNISGTLLEYEQHAEVQSNQLLSALDRISTVESALLSESSLRQELEVNCTLLASALSDSQAEQLLWQQRCQDLQLQYDQLQQTEAALQRHLRQSKLESQEYASLIEKHRIRETLLSFDLDKDVGSSMVLDGDENEDEEDEDAIAPTSSSALRLQMLKKQKRQRLLLQTYQSKLLKSLKERKQRRQLLLVSKRTKRKVGFFAWLFGWSSSEDDETIEEDEDSVFADMTELDDMEVETSPLVDDEEYEAMFQNARATLLEALQRERASVEELEGQVQILQQNNTAIADQVLSRDEVIQELNDRISVFEEDKVVLKAALRQLRREIKDEAPKTQQLMDELVIAQTEGAQLRDDIESLLLAHQEEVDALRNQIEIKDMTIAASNSNLTVIGTYVEKLEERLADFAVARRDIERREAVCRDKENAFNATQNERDKLKKQYDKLTNEHKQIKALLEEMAGERKSLMSQPRNLEKQRDALKKEKEELQKSLEGHQNQLAVLKKVEAELLVDKKRLEDQLVATSNEVKQLEATASDKEKLFNEKLKNATLLVNRLNFTLLEQEKHVANLTGQVAFLEATVQSNLQKQKPAAPEVSASPKVSLSSKQAGPREGNLSDDRQSHKKMKPPADDKPPGEPARRGSTSIPASAKPRPLKATNSVESNVMESAAESVEPPPRAAGSSTGAKPKVQESLSASHTPSLKNVIGFPSNETRKPLVKPNSTVPEIVPNRTAGFVSLTKPPRLTPAADRFSTRPDASRSTFRSVRKSFARVTGLHGFFSRKKPPASNQTKALIPPRPRPIDQNSRSRQAQPVANLTHPSRESPLGRGLLPNAGNATKPSSGTNVKSSEVIQDQRPSLAGQDASENGGGSSSAQTRESLPPRPPRISKPNLDPTLR
jgi:hypothetical protein